MLSNQFPQYKGKINFEFWYINRVMTMLAPSQKKGCKRMSP